MINEGYAIFVNFHEYLTIIDPQHTFLTVLYRTYNCTGSSLTVLYFQVKVVVVCWMNFSYILLQIFVDSFWNMRITRQLFVSRKSRIKLLLDNLTYKDLPLNAPALSGKCLSLGTVMKGPSDGLRTCVCHINMWMQFPWNPWMNFVHLFLGLMSTIWN